MENQLRKLTLKGFKTIHELQDFEMGPLTVLIGPNGAGKSNFISFFRLLAWTLQSPGQLQFHIGQQGGASALLHDGPKKTREIEADLTIDTEAGANQYAFRLFHAGGDVLIFAEEKFRFSRHGFPSPAEWSSLSVGHQEAGLAQKAEEGNTTARVILALLRKIIVYQFHDTSPTARMRGKWDREDNRWLKEDAANIAPFLLRLRESEPAYYARIVETIRLILPFFADFELDEDQSFFLLKWRERGSDRVFNVSQAADGMLRVIALVTLLLQPERDLPMVLILDEPELGLHPFAIDVISGLIRAVAQKRQVLIATQSMTLIDYFEPEDLIVVEREKRESRFKCLDPESLYDWLKEYSLSELWEKNVLGGWPA